MRKLILFMVIASFVFISSSVFALKSEVQVTDVERVFIQCSPTICKVDVKTRIRGPVVCPVYQPPTIPVKVMPRYMERRVITPNLIIPPPVSMVTPVPAPPVCYYPYMQGCPVYWQDFPRCRGFLRSVASLPANIVNAVLQVPGEILY